MAGEAEYIQREVQESDTDSAIKSETLELLEKSQQICETTQDEEICQQYEEVQLAAIGSLKELRLSVAHDLGDFRDELSSQDPDISNGTILAEELDIIREEADDVERLNIEKTLTGWAKLPEELESLENTPFGEYSPDQALAMLEFYQQALPTYRERGVATVDPSSDSYSNIGGKPALRTAQQILINTVYGENTYENGFSGDMLVGYASDEGGNHLRDVGSFERRLSEGADLNPLMFANYVKYKQSQTGDVGEAFKEIVILCGDRIDRIEELIKNTQSDNTEIYEVQQLLISEGLFSPEKGFIGKALEGFQSLAFDYTKEVILTINQGILTGAKSGSEALSGIQEVLNYRIAGKGLDTIIGEDAVRSANNLCIRMQQKMSQENAQTQMITASQMVHKFGVRVCPAALRGNFFEQANDACMKGLLENFIQGEENLAIEYTEDTGYCVKNEADFLYSVQSHNGYIKDPRHKHEVGTYLAGLSKSDISLLPEKIGMENLIALSTYTDGEFGGESFTTELGGTSDSWSDFYAPHMIDFEVSLPGLMSTAVRDAQDSESLTDFIIGGFGVEGSTEIMANCPFCEKIDSYTNITDITLALSSSELREAQPEFYAALEARLDIYTEREDKIRNSLIDLTLDSLGRDELPAELLERINTLTVSIDTQISNEITGGDPNTICTLTLKLLVDSNPDLQAYEQYLESTYSTPETPVEFDSGSFIDTATVVGIESEILIVDANIQAAVSRQTTLSEIPVEQQTPEMIDEFAGLGVYVQEAEEDRETLERKQEVAEVIQTEDIRELDSEGRTRVQSLIMSGADITQINNMIDLFKSSGLSEVINDPEKYVGTVESSTDMLHLFHEYPDVFQNISYSQLHPNLQTQVRVLKGFPNPLKIEDINSLPNSFFEDQGNILHLIQEAVGNEIASGAKIGKILLRHYDSTGENIALCINTVYSILEHGDFSESQKNYIKSMIPTLYIREDTENSLQIDNPQERISTISEVKFQALVTKMENGSLGLQERRDFDAFIGSVSMGAHQSAVELFIQKGYFKNAPQIQHAVSRYSEDIETNSRYHIIALEENPNNIRYFSRNLRKKSDTIQTLVNNAESESQLKTLLPFIPIDSAFNFHIIITSLVERFGSESRARIIIASNPLFFNSLNDILDEELKNLRPGEEISSDTQEIINVLGVYAEMREKAVQAQANIASEIEIGGNEALQERNRTKIRERGLEIFKNNGIEPQDNENINKVLDVIFTSPEISAEAIALLSEACGGNEELALSILKELSAIKIADLLSQNEQAEEALTLLGYSDDQGNLKELFGRNNNFSMDLFEASYNAFIQSDDAPKQGIGEDTQDYLKRVKDAYLAFLNADGEQAKELLIIFQNNATIFDAIAYLDPETAQTHYRAAMSGGQEALDLVNNQRLQGLIDSGGTFPSRHEIETILRDAGYNTQSTSQENESQEQNNHGGGISSESTEASEYANAIWDPKIQSLTLSSGVEVPLTIQDRDIIKANPEKAEQIASCYQHFLDIDCEAMYPYKDDIIREISNNKGVAIDITDGDYLDDRETNLVLSTLLYVTTQNQKYKSVGASLDQTKNNFTTEVSGVTGEQVKSVHGNALETSFIHSFTHIDKSGDKGKFDYIAFRKAMKGNFQKTETLT